MQYPGAWAASITWLVNAPRIQRDLNFQDPRIAQECFVVLAVDGDDQGACLGAVVLLEVLVDVGRNLRTVSYT